MRCSNNLENQFLTFLPTSVIFPLKNSKKKSEIHSRISHTAQNKKILKKSIPLSSCASYSLRTLNKISHCIEKRCPFSRNRSISLINCICSNRIWHLLSIFTQYSLVFLAGWSCCQTEATDAKMCGSN